MTCAVTMEKITSEMKVEVGGYATAHLTAARYFRCFNGAVPSVSVHAGMKRASMVGDVKDRGEGGKGGEPRCQAKWATIG